MSEKNEKQLGQLFCEQVQQLDDKTASQDVVEQVVAYTNRQTGLRDIIELFFASTFAVLLGWAGVLSVKTQKTFMPSAQKSTINDGDNKKP